MLVRIILTGEDADLAVQDAAQARLNAETAMDIDRSPSPDEETDRFRKGASGTRARNL